MKKLHGVLAAILMPWLAWAGPVNVNTADAETISRELKGVGLAKAQAIVAYREANGVFAAPGDLLNVKGIGPRVLEDNDGDILTAD